MLERIQRSFWVVLLVCVLVFQPMQAALAGCPIHDPKPCPPPSDHAPVTTTTGDRALDEKMIEEYRNLCMFFGQTPCLFIFGELDSLDATTFRDSNRYVIKFGNRLLNDFLKAPELRDYAIAGIMAHEFDHVVQHQRDTPLRAKNMELHADFMAGFYLKHLGREESEVETLASKFFEYGNSYLGIRQSWYFPEVHGTPRERVKALLQGFRSDEKSFDGAYSSGERWFKDRQWKNQ